MKKELQIALRFYHYLKVVRDTLEYTFNDAQLKALDFDNRYKFLKESLNEGEPLDILVKNNGEAGTKVKERLSNFIEEVFESGTVTKDGEFIRVDKARRLRLLNEILGMRETFLDIVLSHIKFLEETNNLSPELDQLIKAEDYLYRSIAILVLIDNMRYSFVEYNNYLHESKGEKTPQSNFVGNDIGQYIQMLGFIASRKFFDEPNFAQLLKASQDQIDFIQGKVTIENPEKRFEIFIVAKQTADKTLHEAEKKWIDIYRPIIEELQAEESRAKFDA